MYHKKHKHLKLAKGLAARRENKIMRTMKRLMTIMLLLCCVMMAGAQTEEGKQRLAKAQAGDAEAQESIGCYYYYGWEGFSKNSAEACKWYRKAAENGNADAQRNMYLNRGEFGLSDDEAVQWLRKAAENGHDDAQRELGMKYHWGELGLPEDNDQAIKWCLKSANQGNEVAMFDLGLIYEDINKDEAIYWFKKEMDAHYAESGEESETASERLRELGVYYHPSNKSSSTASSSSRSSSSGSSSSSSSSGSSSSELLAKGIYTVNSQGYSTSSGQYTGYIGGDFVVSVEFYDDHIVVLGTTCKYIGTYNGYKKYKGNTMSLFGTSTDFYYVDSNYNMYKETLYSSQYGSDVFRHTMAKGEVTLPKGEVYNPSFNSGNVGVSRGNSTGRNSYNSNGQSSSRSSCSLCHGRGRIVRTTSVSTFGNDYKVKCNECGGWFMKSTGHSHITCPQCHGNIAF